MTGQGGPRPPAAAGAQAHGRHARDQGHGARADDAHRDHGQRASDHAHRPNSVPPPWAKRILWGLFVLCAALALADVPALIRHWRHEEHPWEALPMLYPLWGFVGISVLILASKGLRRLVMRPEDYYEAARAGEADAGAGAAEAEAADADHADGGENRA